ncbi:MAG: hypothetical protein ACJ796_10400 [Gemmatimonadaceae bacterium]
MSSSSANDRITNATAAFPGGKLEPGEGDEARPTSRVKNLLLAANATQRYNR